MSHHQEKPNAFYAQTNQLQETLKDLETALQIWDSIPTSTVDADLDAFKKKTRELVQKLNSQIEALGL